MPAPEDQEEIQALLLDRLDHPFAAVLNTTTFGTFGREYSPLTLRVGINRIETSEMPTGIAG